MTATEPRQTSTATAALAVIAAALGFFVDAYDLILFSIVRVQSLTGLGVPPERLLAAGVDLLNAQLMGISARSSWLCRSGTRSAS